MELVSPLGLRFFAKKRAGLVCDGFGHRGIQRESKQPPQHSPAQLLFGLVQHVSKKIEQRFFLKAIIYIYFGEDWQPGWPSNDMFLGPNLLFGGTYSEHNSATTRHDNAFFSAHDLFLLLLLLLLLEHQGSIDNKSIQIASFVTAQPRGSDECIDHLDHVGHLGFFRCGMKSMGQNPIFSVAKYPG